jgi:trigger factor
MREVKLESKVNAISKVEHEVEVKLDYEEIKPEIEKAYEKERKNIVMPGFRKGKVPIPMIKKFYGPEIEQRASENIANTKFWEIVKDQNLKPISTPKLTELKLDKESGLTFKIRYEVQPELEVKDYKNIEVEKPIFKVTEEDIEKELKALLISHASFEKAEKVENEDYRITVDIKLADSKEDDFIEKGTKLNLNDSKLNEEIKKNALGKKVGDEIEFTIIDEHKHGEETHKAEHKYIAIIRDIEKFIFPELTEEFCKKVTKDKATNEKELREFFKNNYEEYFEAEADKIYTSELLDKVVKNNDFELPKEFLNNYLDELVEREQKKYEQQGYGKIGKDILRIQLRPQAEWTTKWEIIMENIAKKENIEVTDEDLRKLAEEEAKKTGISVEKLIKYYKDSNKKFELLEKKVVDFLKEVNPPKEIDGEEWEKKQKAKNDEKKDEGK